MGNTQTKFTLEEIVNPERFSAGLVFSVHTSGRAMIRNKDSRFGRVSRDFESGISIGNFEPETFESEEFCRVDDFPLESGFFSASELLSLR